MTHMSKDPLRHHRAHRQGGLIGPSVAEHAAENFADFLGTVRFIVISSLAIVGWIVLNATQGGGVRFDPYPFILLNLAFSAFAFYTGALVIIAQKASAKRDREREQADAVHREELHGQLVALLQANTDLTAQVHQLVAGEATNA